MLCLDTYALMEMLEESPAYERISHAEFVIPDSTLAEFYSLMCKKPNEKTAKYWLEKFRPYARPVGLDVWIGAVRYRAAHRQKNLSIFDCLGYAFSRANNCKFVTGDKEFRGAEGVEYIE